MLNMWFISLAKKMSQFLRKEAEVTLSTDVMDVFVGESLSAAVLDSGCSDVVKVGWRNIYIL